VPLLVPRVGRAKTIYCRIPCHLLVPIVAPRLFRNQNLRCLMHKEFNSSCIRYLLRFPFWRSLGATIGTERCQDKKKSQPLFANLALPAVSTTACTKLTSGRSSSLSTMAFGRWISTTKIDEKNLVITIFSLCSSRFIRLVSVPLLASPS
jgi:hypothetical protein